MVMVMDVASRLALVMDVDLVVDQAAALGLEMVMVKAMVMVTGGDLLVVLALEMDMERDLEMDMVRGMELEMGTAREMEM